MNHIKTFKSFIFEALSKQEILNFENDGYVEATLIKSINSEFKKDETVMVNAEEYASLGSGDLLKIISIKTGKDLLVDKDDLSVSI